MKKKLILISVFATTTIASTLSIASTGYLEGAGKNGPGESIQDIETINYFLKRSPERILDKRSDVSGEITDVIDERAFIIESGGIYDNEILLVASNNVQKRDLHLIKKGVRVKVVGQVRKIALADLQRELDWTLPAPIVAKLQKGPGVWFVADLIMTVMR